MISKSKIDFIRSLKLKKNRDEFNLFIAEGSKLSTEIILSGFCVKLLVGTKEWIQKNALDKFKNIQEVAEVSLSEMERISAHKSPPDVLLVAEKSIYTFDEKIINTDLVLVLDNIQDPGNLGTIIRTADWFGIKNIICSSDSVDLYNPKVIQSTMGSVCRVKVHYMNLFDFFSKISNNIPVYGAFMEGESVYQLDVSESGIIIIGNEGSGISNELLSFIKTRISIPRYFDSEAESLNASIAAAIICNEFRRHTR